MKNKAAYSLPVILILMFACRKMEVTPPTPQFNMVYGGSAAEAANSIVLSNDGGYVAAGETSSNDKDVSGNHGRADVWVYKVDANGYLLWQKTFGGTSADGAAAVVNSADGGYVVAGYTQSNNGDVTGFHGGDAFDFDFWVVKIDRNGNKLWQKALGGTRIDNALSIAKSPDGGYVIAGYTQSNDGDVSGFHGDVDAWVVKIDEAGNKLWQKTYGGSAADYAYSITAATGGGYVLTGQTLSNNGDLSSNHGGTDLWVFAIDANGNLLWQKTFGGSGNDYGRSITTSSAGYAVAGYTTSNNGDVTGYKGGSDAWVISIDKNGNKLWQKTYGGSGGDLALTITKAPLGGFAVGGQTLSNDGDVTGNHGNGDAFFFTTDDNGSLRGVKTLGGSNSDAVTGIVATPGKSFTLSAYSASSDGNISNPHGSTDAWLFTVLNL